MYKFGPVQKKIILALLGGVALGMSSSPRQYFKTLRVLRKDWKKIDQRNFNRSIKRLSREKFIEEKKLPDGSFKLILTKEGKRQAKMLSLLGSSINFKKPKRWDKKWRIVLFDIPEKDRVFRNILRDHLKTLGFHKLQHSVFISPYPFEKSLLELVALYSVEPYVRIITATKIDNESKIKRRFFKNGKNK
ncbi:MAG TPA: CRISPR-associated endonuclease Cas2 [Candidatus Moranbacteria bacterium]|nr:CRISPR-associated endonuclease Cas2 [Candidatus Moranbacteria bacterium]